MLNEASSARVTNPSHKLHGLNQKMPGLRTRELARAEGQARQARKGRWTRTLDRQAEERRPGGPPIKVAPRRMSLSLFHRVDYGGCLLKRYPLLFKDLESKSFKTWVSGNPSKIKSLFIETKSYLTLRRILYASHPTPSNYYSLLKLKCFETIRRK